MIIKSLVALLLFLFATVFQSLWGQEGYKIRFKVTNLDDSLCYLVNYHGDKTYLIDTAVVNNDKFVFKGKQSLGKGMYMIAGESKNRYFDFIINDANRIRFSTDTTQWLNDMIVKGSPENRLLFDYVIYLDKKRLQMDSLSRELKVDSLDQQVKTSILAGIDRVNQEVIQHQKDLIEDNQGTFFATFLKASLEPEVFEVLTKEMNTPKRDSLLLVYKAHFWDNLDLRDDRLLRSPLYYKRLEWYMNDFVFPVPDTIMYVVDSILTMVSHNETVYEYLLWYFTLKYDQSKIMGFDEIFVYIANTYYKTGKADCFNETVKTNVINRAGLMEPLLIGKRAPEMILLDTSDNEVSFYQTNASYTVIYFWEPDCSFCSKETPKLKQFYEANKDTFNLEIYAVCIDTSMTEWKKYVRENNLNWINVNGFLSITEDFHKLYNVSSSPVIFLLDEKKKIVAKHILSDQLLGIIQRRESQKRYSNVNN